MDSIQTPIMAQTNSNKPIPLEKKRSLSPESSEEVRVLGIDEYEQAAQSLAEAFAVDEVARYFIDTDDMASYSEEYKWKLHCDILRYITAAHCYKGIVTTIGPDYDAVALWYASCFPNLFSCVIYVTPRTKSTGKEGPG